MKSGLFQGLMNLVRKNPDVIADAGMSAALTAGMGLLTGDPGAAVKYGIADFIASYPTTLAVRGLRPKGNRIVIDPKTGKQTTEVVRSKLELPANIGASVLSGLAVSSMDAPAPAPTNVSQQQQILQQNLQRDLINKGVLAGGMANAYFPGTMLQAQGLESTYVRDLVNDAMMGGPQVNIDQLGREMGAIVGV